MEVKKITEGMTAPQVAQVIDDNFKAQNKILEEDIAKQNSVIGVSEYKDFSEAEAVNVGNVRKYNGFLYECVEATTGAFDASKWKKSSFKAETEKKLTELGSEVSNIVGWDYIQTHIGRLGQTEIVDDQTSNYKIIKVFPGDVLEIAANEEEDSLIAILKNFDFSSVKKLDLVDKYQTRINIPKKGRDKIVMPEDAKYLIVASLWSGADRTPTDIKVNNISLYLPILSNLNGVKKGIEDINMSIGVYSTTIEADTSNSKFVSLGRTFKNGETILVKLLGSEPLLSAFSAVLTYRGTSVQTLGVFKGVGSYAYGVCSSEVDSLYLNVSEPIKVTFAVSNNGINQQINIIKEEFQEVNNDVRFQSVAVSTLEGWYAMAEYVGQLGNTAISGNDINAGSYKIMSVSSNDKVRFTASEQKIRIAILKSFNFNDTSSLDFAAGYENRISLEINSSKTFIMPEDARYIVVARNWGSVDTTPADITINGRSLFNRDSCVTNKKFSAIYLGLEKRHILESIEWGNGTISSDGSEGDSETFIKTDFIDISGIDLLRLDINQEEELFCTIGLYDKNKQFIKRLNTRVSAQYQFNGNLRDNADCHYVKISSNTTDTSLLTISVDVLPSRYYNRRLLSNKNIKSFSHAGSSLMAGVTEGRNLPSSMWGTYLNGFDAIHCNLQFTTDNVGYCLHDPTFVDEITGETITLCDHNSEFIDNCRFKGQPLAKVESVIYLAKMMGLDVCLYSIYGSNVGTNVIAEIIRMVKTYGMFEHIYFGISYSDVGLQYLDAVYNEYPKAKILLTQPSIPTIEYAQMEEVLQRAKNVLSTRPELEVYLWLNSGYDAASLERLNMEKPCNIKVGCFAVTKEQEPIVFPYVDIYTSASGLRSFGIARRDIEVAVTNKYPEFLMGDYGNIV